MRKKAAGPSRPTHCAQDAAAKVERRLAREAHLLNLRGGTSLEELGQQIELLLANVVRVAARVLVPVVGSRDSGSLTRHEVRKGQRARGDRRGGVRVPVCHGYLIGDEATQGQRTKRKRIKRTEHSQMNGQSSGVTAKQLSANSGLHKTRRRSRSGPVEGGRLAARVRPPYKQSRPEGRRTSGRDVVRRRFVAPL